MQRRARLRFADVPLHIIQRGNNRIACFFAEQDYRFYLRHLEEPAQRFACWAGASSGCETTAPSARFAIGLVVCPGLSLSILAIVSRSLEQLKATRIVIAHRLSTVINADRIIVLQNGSIVQTGNYAELITQQGPFADLAKRQIA